MKKNNGIIMNSYSPQTFSPHIPHIYLFKIPLRITFIVLFLHIRYALRKLLRKKSSLQFTLKSHTPSVSQNYLYVGSFLCLKGRLYPGLYKCLNHFTPDCPGRGHIIYSGKLFFLYLE